MSNTKKNGIDAITLLKDDHQRVKYAFAHFEELGPNAYVSKRELADEICRELTIHTQLEEEIIYPTFRKNLNGEKSLVNEAQVEHDSAKVLIKEIQKMNPDEQLFDAKVKVLAEYVDHHVKEEEEEMFPLMQQSDIDLNLLGKKLMDRKQELHQNGY